MKLKKCMVLLCIIGLFIFCLLPIPIGNATNGLEGIKNGMGGVASGTNDPKLNNVFNIVINLIQYAGSGVAVIMATILGIKYMTSSAGDRADIKKQVIPFVIGCVIFFAAVGVTKVIADVGASFNTVK